MRIGYACINTALPCKSSGAFRLSSFSKERFLQTAKENLSCLYRILEFNREKGIKYFRISSDLIPFGSHSVLKINWKKEFKEDLRRIGAFIKACGMRVCMHPGQYTLLNSPRPEVAKNSLADLLYHCDVLDGLGLNGTHKVQIHAGGVYGDKPAALERFCERYRALPQRIKKRLVIENDDKLYTASDCVHIWKKTGVPVVFDFFHHSVKNGGENFKKILSLCAKTWKRSDGVPMTDYSSQKPGARAGSHSETIDIEDFIRTFRGLSGRYDCILEIKDKQESVLKLFATEPGFLFK